VCVASGACLYGEVDELTGASARIGEWIMSSRARRLASASGLCGCACLAPGAVAFAAFSQPQHHEIATPTVVGMPISSGSGACSLVAPLHARAKAAEKGKKGKGEGKKKKKKSGKKKK
jgi:hypothetical protein